MKMYKYKIIEQKLQLLLREKKNNEKEVWLFIEDQAD